MTLLARLTVRFVTNFVSLIITLQPSQLLKLSAACCLVLQSNQKTRIRRKVMTHVVSEIFKDGPVDRFGLRGDPVFGTI